MTTIRRIRGDLPGYFNKSSGFGPGRSPFTTPTTLDSLCTKTDTVQNVGIYAEIIAKTHNTAIWWTTCCILKVVERAIPLDYFPNLNEKSQQKEYVSLVKDIFDSASIQSSAGAILKPGLSIPRSRHLHSRTKKYRSRPKYVDTLRI